jgi:ATP adenylyltransferase
MIASTIRIQVGTLRQAIERQTRQAVACGAVRPIETKCAFVDDGGVHFVVRSVSSLERKTEDKAARQRRPDLSANPFLPYEELLFVSDISDTHIGLLNKFNVTHHHLLIVTRRFEDQQTLLTRSDLQALWACMAEFEALGFYNGGTVAGASQRHKHLQMVPLPLAPEGPAIPIEPLIARASVGDIISTLPGLPFVHAFSRLDPALSARPDEAAAVTLERYYALLNAVALTATHGDNQLWQSGPYNLLITRRWMLLVPRSKEFFDSISINALGFAGSLFVQNQEQMQAIQAAGPIKVLQHVTIDKDG